MGNDHSSKISTQTTKLLHDPAQEPYATFIINLFLREFYSYHKDGSKDYSDADKLFKHKRAIVTKIFDGVQIFEEGPFESHKSHESISWHVTIEVHLSRENFHLFYQNPVTFKLTYFNYFGVFEGEYSIKDWRDLPLSCTEDQKLLELVKKEGSGDNIYSEISCSMVGPFLEDMVGLNLPKMELKEQLDLLHFIERYRYSTYLNQRHDQWLDDYYGGEKLTARIINVIEKILETKEIDQRYLEWAAEHFKCCSFREKKNEAFPVSSEKYESLLVLLEKLEKPDRSLITAFQRLDTLLKAYQGSRIAALISD